MKEILGTLPPSPGYGAAGWKASLLGVYAVLFLCGALDAAELPVKQHAAFYTPEHLAQIRTNVRKDPWATRLRDDVLAEIGPWMNLSDEELWGLIFGATIPRSWMVW